MSETSSARYTQLMAAVGGTLLSWSQVETAMGLLFYNVSGIKDMDKAGAIFDAVISFEARIAILDAAMEYEPIYDEEEKAVWANLSTRLRKQYKKRHEVAHFSLEDISEMKKQQISPFFTWNKHARNTKRYLDIAQIYERSSKFSECSAAVGWFNNLAQHRRPPPPKGFRPPLAAIPDLIDHIRALAALKNAEQKPPPQS